jgi:DNA-binding transcriptional LysR family regulator
MAPRFDLIDLQLFLHIAGAASITHGAGRSNMSLAAASERVRAMEDALGIPLLERKRRGVGLTPAGAALVHHARVVVQQLEQMRGELGTYAKGLRGRIRVLSPTVGMFEYLPAALSAFLSAHPNVDIDLEERISNEVVREIAAGLADIGITAGPIDVAAELETFPFAKNRHVLVVPKTHALARHRKIGFALALEHDFVGLGADHPLQALVEQYAQRAGRVMRVRVHLSSFEVICQMVANGTGIAVVPEVAARRWARSMPLHVVVLTDPWTIRHLTVCVKSLESLSPHARNLAEFLRAQKAPMRAIANHGACRGA